MILLSIATQTLAQSFDGSDPRGPRCVSDCQCQFVTGSTGVCMCEEDDGTDDDCPFTDGGGIDDRGSTGKDGKSGGKDGKGKSGGKSKNKRRELTSKQSGKSSGKSSKSSGNGGGDGGTPRDGGDVGLPFGAFCCDCECIKKPCACECFGYGTRRDGGGVDGGDDSGKGKSGKGKSGKGKSKRTRRLSQVEVDDEQEENDISHVRSRLSRGHVADATSDSGNGWKSWVYNSIWSSNKDSDEKDHDSNVEDDLTGDRNLKTSSKSKTSPTKQSKSAPAPGPSPKNSPSPTNGRDSGGVGGCERPPYTCSYVKFYPGESQCASRRFCKANTFGYCQMNSRSS
ncbi:hypothetical protein IV203_011623 [Nitzschia inconspicua]|uniref:Uncharacterized protein n=1 Tax=Nitzschia inconspicua TaxID=303405 RepID=A0A9K3KSV3_9STRA|nr:hypothetical protein IV203_011623 [Nitzschia inconspicua]